MHKPILGPSSLNSRLYRVSESFCNLQERNSRHNLSRSLKLIYYLLITLLIIHLHLLNFTEINLHLKSEFSTSTPQRSSASRVKVSSHDDFERRIRRLSSLEFARLNGHSAVLHWNFTPQILRVVTVLNIAIVSHPDAYSSVAILPFECAHWD